MKRCGWLMLRSQPDESAYRDSLCHMIGRRLPPIKTGVVIGYLSRLLPFNPGISFQSFPNYPIYQQWAYSFHLDCTDFDEDAENMA